MATNVVTPANGPHHSPTAHTSRPRYCTPATGAESFCTARAPTPGTSTALNLNDEWDDEEIDLDDEWEVDGEGPDVTTTVYQSSPPSYSPRQISQYHDPQDPRLQQQQQHQQQLQDHKRHQRQQEPEPQRQPQQQSQKQQQQQPQPHQKQEQKQKKQQKNQKQEQQQHHQRQQEQPASKVVDPADFSALGVSTAKCAVATKSSSPAAGSENRNDESHKPDQLQSISSSSIGGALSIISAPASYDGENIHNDSGKHDSLLSEVPIKEGMEEKSPRFQLSPARSSHSEVSGASPPPGDVKSKLRSALGNFENIENTLRIGARQRRDADEHRLATLRLTMNSLEETLATEIARRIELKHSLQEWCRNSIATLRDDISHMLDEHGRRMEQLVERLENRVGEAEGRMEQEGREVPLAVERRARDVEGLLNEVRGTFEEEKTDRLRRESQILQRIDDHRLEISHVIAHEKNSRESALSDLRVSVDEHERERDEADLSFRSITEQDLRGLRNQIRSEARTRADDDRSVVAALERYTSKLQTSLTIVSSEEVGRL
eukprot:CAMPEP_0113311728 /NCGR_PEP_ID=MMETSP0010_2-20120614/8839_1 /TAXON_ID=216773 ORGANISM="Corethron hystrix, Strain 308" /NCGR_SAMPLE_ID=MMETSP0010_2 /ASSEMBLY_ACC=CAM_ASM_000155 /LENGTH=546 /DNA_ID=CAMNT_0000167405 /DNA_START=30 /DNA_END=1670 /DNA_ORIENTATION=+ /assembly_acc=CAM_ASM_000155